ncbi:MAG: hypothetical protein GC190_18195 [Alphaproteobacteria bacterium]|nr:hypothetical protein [Alphaproteobacteria bacterium]
MDRIERRLDAERIASSLRAIAAPIFAAAWSSGSDDAALLVHVAAAPRRAQLRLQIRDALSAIGIERIRVRFHNAAQLHAPRSLERLVARFGGEDVVYDPTEAVGRAKALVNASRAVRGSVSNKLFGLYYAPRLRTFYVALKAANLVSREKIKIAELASIECAVVEAMKAAFAPKLEDCPAVRVGFGLPQANLVAVDRRSVIRWTTHLAAAAKRYWKPITVAALFGLGMTGTAAADGDGSERAPAVSQTNLKISGSGGQTNDESSWSVNAGLTVPVGKFTGVQLEAGGLGVDDDSIFAAGAHIFTRDPDKYLLGLFASYAKEDQFDLEAEQVGAEAELYMAQVSLLAKAGYQFSDKIGDSAFGGIDLRWYATDNFAITAGGSFQQDQNQGHLSAEFLPGLSALPGLAFNVQGVIGDDDYHSVMGGITYYFGSNASLKDRHRRQDPESSLLNLFHSVEQERERMAAIYGTTPPQ